MNRDQSTPSSRPLPARLRKDGEEAREAFLEATDWEDLIRLAGHDPDEIRQGAWEAHLERQEAECWASQH
jgi:hypothetical protein